MPSAAHADLQFGWQLDHIIVVADPRRSSQISAPNSLEQRFRPGRTEREAWHYIAPGEPVQNAFVESFNGRLHNELLEGDGSAFYRRRREC